jgi:hypothetical protein
MSDHLEPPPDDTGWIKQEQIGAPAWLAWLLLVLGLLLVGGFAVVVYMALKLWAY